MNRLVAHSQKAAFPLAAASLNVSLMLCSFFRLLTSAAGGAGAVAPCSDATLRKLLSFHNLLAPVEGSACALDLLHEKCLLRCWDAWEALPADTVKVMRFPTILADLSEHITQTCAATPGPWSIGPNSILYTLRPIRSSGCPRHEWLFSAYSSANAPLSSLEPAQLVATLRALPSVTRLLSVLSVLCFICPRSAATAAAAQA